MDPIRVKIDEIFKNAPHSKKIQDLKEEMISNLEEKYQDLISCGKTEQEAYDISIASIGDIDELIRSMSEGEGSLYKMPMIEKKSSQENKVILDKKQESVVNSAPQMTAMPNRSEKQEKRSERPQAKKVDVVSITILSCLGVFVLFVIVRIAAAMNHAAPIGHFQMNVAFGNLEVAKEESTEIKGINKIEGKLLDADVEISFWDENTVKVIESTNDEKKEELFSITQSGNTLKITRPAPKNMQFLGSNAYHKVQIFIPQTYQEELVVATTSGSIDFLTDMVLKNLSVATSSGDTSSESNCKVNSFSQESTSGYVEYADIESEQYTIQASSGDVKINKLIGEGTINTTSGYVSLENIEGEKHKIITSSGDIEIDNGSGDFEIETTSGYKKLGKLSGKEHSIKSSSGDIDAEELIGKCEMEGTSSTIQVDKYEGENLKVTTSSGSITVKELAGAFEQKTSSGDVTIGIKELTDDSKLQTTSGRVELSRNGNVNAEITCHTNSGDVDGDCEMTYSNKDKDDAKAVWGDGSENKISVETSSGDIELNH